MKQLIILEAGLLVTILSPIGHFTGPSSAVYLHTALHVYRVDSTVDISDVIFRMTRQVFVLTPVDKLSFVSKNSRTNVCVNKASLQTTLIQNLIAPTSACSP